MIADVCEIFYSLQLEGSYVGYPAVFVRFSGCNLSCEFCDTKYAFNTHNILAIKEVYKKVASYDCRRVIFTGGEPLLQKTFIKEFMSHYRFDYFLETNGTICVDFIDKFTHVVVSPKFYSINYDCLKIFALFQNVEFKFLVGESNDFQIIQDLCLNLGISSFTIQPIFIENDNLQSYKKRIKKLIEIFKNSQLKNFDARFIVQNHKFIYLNKRGV